MNKTNETVTVNRLRLKWWDDADTWRWNEREYERFWREDTRVDYQASEPGHSAIESEQGKEENKGNEKTYNSTFIRQWSSRIHLPGNDPGV